MSNVQTTCSVEVWHDRLGHPCPNVLARVLKSCEVPFKHNKLHSVCSSCQISKAYKLPFSASRTVYSAPFELVVSDVWGPSHVPSNGFTYYVSFVDMYSRFSWLYFLKSKNEVFQCFLLFHKIVQVQFGTSIRMLQTDGGCEYRSLSNTFARLGIQHRLTCPHTSEQNGVAERKHRHIVDMGLALLARVLMPLEY